MREVEKVFVDILKNVGTALFVAGVVAFLFEEQVSPGSAFKAVVAGALIMLYAILYAFVAEKQ